MYDEFVHLLEAQTKDPITGVMYGDKAPGPSNMQEEDDTCHDASVN